MIVLTNAINVYRAEKVSRRLDESSTFNVLRSGKKQQINVCEINVGDILVRNLFHELGLIRKIYIIDAHFCNSSLSPVI